MVTKHIGLVQKGRHFNANGGQCNKQQQYQPVANFKIQKQQKQTVIQILPQVGKTIFLLFGKNLIKFLAWKPKDTGLGHSYATAGTLLLVIHRILSFPIIIELIQKSQSFYKIRQLASFHFLCDIIGVYHHFFQQQHVYMLNEVGGGGGGG